MRLGVHLQLLTIKPIMSLNPIKAQMLLAKCNGDEIWSLETCRQEGVPPDWIEELADCFESGFNTNRNTIYENNHVTNQYEGILDLHLAYKLAEYLGVDWKTATAFSMGRTAEVQAIKEAFEES